MATLQLSGKMVYLNGTDQYLRRLDIGSINWNALWVRVCYRQSFPVEGENFLIHVGITGGNFCCYVKQWVGDWGEIWQMLQTTGGRVRQLAYPIYGFTNIGAMGPIDVDVVWNGSQVAFYRDGTRMGLANLTGTLSDTLHIALGAHYNGYGLFKGYIGYAIIHNAVPPFLADLPDNLGTRRICGLTGTEFLKIAGITESDVLCFYDFRNNDGTNYGSGGSTYDLEIVGSPTFSDCDFLYRIVDDLIAEAWLDCEYSPAQMDLGTFLFHARGNGGVPPYSYQWLFSNDHGENWIPVGDRDFLIVESSPPGEYWVKCQITDAEENTDESEIIKVEVYTDSLALDITTDTGGGEPPLDVTITCSPSGGSGTYSSFKYFCSNDNGSTWTETDWLSNDSYTWEDLPEGEWWFKAQVKDSEDATAESEIHRIKVYDIKPRLHLSLSDACIAENTSTTLTMTVSEGTSPFDYEIDWGDGSTSETYLNEGSTLVKSHTYTDEGEHQITVTVTDNNNSTDQQVIDVCVSAAHPCLHLDLLDACFVDSGITQLTMSVANGIGPFNYEIDWGDGSSPETYLNEESSTLVKNHSYSEPGDYRIEVTVTDTSSGNADTQIIYVCVSEVYSGGGAGGGVSYSEAITEYSGLVILKVGETWSVVRDITDFEEKENLYYELFQINSSHERVTLIPKTKMKESKVDKKRYAQVDLSAFTSRGDYYLLLSRGTIAKNSEKYQLIKIRAE